SLRLPGLGRGHEIDLNRHETEADRTLPECTRWHDRPLSGLAALSGLLFDVLFDAPAPAIARAEDFFGRDHRSARRPLHAQRTSELVHDVLIGRRDAAAHSLFA